MTLTDDCNTAVRRLVRAVFGLGENDVRPANQTAPAGQQAVAFATVLILSDVAIGMETDDTESDGAGGIIESVETPEQFVASVQFWGLTPTPAQLRGAAVSDDVSVYTGVTAGTLSLPIDGAARAVTGIDLSAAATMPDVAGLLQARFAAALAGVTVVWTAKRFIVTSPTTGQPSAVGAADVAAVATLLGLTGAAGAVGSDNKSGIAKPSTEAFDRARRLPRLLSFQQNVTLMQELGLGYVDASPARNLAALAPGGAFESRGSIDLTFNIISRETLVAAAFSDITVGLQVLEPDGIIKTRAIEVTP